MKTRKIIFFLITLLFVNSSLSAVQKEGDEKTMSFKVNKGGTLNVNINPGSIYLIPWDKNEVYIKIKNLDGDEAKNVEAYQEGNSVIVKYNSEWGWGSEIELSINLPSQHNIEAKTTGGDVSVRGNIVGNLDLSTMGGDVSTKDVKGKVKISTQGGDLSVGNIEGGLMLSTMGGDVTIGEVIGETAKISTMGGDIKVVKVASGIEAVTYGGDIDIKSVGGTSQVQTMGGSIELGSVNGAVMMQTYGGNLIVKSASGSINATTNAGDIVLRNITGSVNAKTSAGDIIVDINPSANSSSKLFSNNGSIEISLPSTAKATIDAEIKVRGYWKNMKSDFKIRSDFEAKTYTADDKDRKIKATYVVNGGGGKIFASSNNENIVIKKISK